MRISVYLGSHAGKNPIYMQTARELGRRLAEEGIGVVYGGANVGTMGALADGVKEAGGECIGVYPEGFKGRPDVAARGERIREEGISQMIITKNFAERKQKMEDLSDCCVALAGSWGTLDELFTYTTNSQLRFNGGKPIFVLNTEGYYNTLEALLAHMYEEGFIDDYARGLIQFVKTPEELIGQLRILQSRG